MNTHKFLLRFMLFGGLLSILPACWGDGGKAPATGLFVINLLDEQLFNDCHIKGSINVSLEDLEEFAQKLDRKSAEVVVYCSNYRCSSSEYAWKKLTDMGFKHVWAYEGGTAEWYQLHFPVVGACKRSYLFQKMKRISSEDEEEIATITADELAKKLGVTSVNT